MERLDRREGVVIAASIFGIIQLVVGVVVLILCLISGEDPTWWGIGGAAGLLIGCYFAIAGGCGRLRWSLIVGMVLSLAGAGVVLVCAIWFLTRYEYLAEFNVGIVALSLAAAFIGVMTAALCLAGAITGTKRSDVYAVAMEGGYGTVVAPINQLAPPQNYPAEIQPRVTVESVDTGAGVSSQRTGFHSEQLKV